MPTWDDVHALATALPEVERGTDTNGFKWEVRHRYFAWERPLRTRDLEELGNAAPTGPILGVKVAELDDKQALIGSAPEIFFTVPHFAGYPAVLVLIERISLEQLNEVLIDAWLCRAPKRLAATYLAEHPFNS